jgi:hypothetical protein
MPHSLQYPRSARGEGETCPILDSAVWTSAGHFTTDLRQLEVDRHGPFAPDAATQQASGLLY